MDKVFSPRTCSGLSQSTIFNPPARQSLTSLTSRRSASVAPHAADRHTDRDHPTIPIRRLGGPRQAGGDRSRKTPSFTVRRTTNTPYSLEKLDINPIFRENLRAWHVKHGQEKQQDLSAWFDSSDLESSTNATARRGDAERVDDPENHDPTSFESQDFALDTKDLDVLDPHHRLLRRGDLVEMQFKDNSRDPVVAVFVRRLETSAFSQFFTSSGKWIHARETAVAFCIPNYIRPELLDAMLPHLPTVADTALNDQGSLYDLAVPREISAPVVSRLSNFMKQSLDLYRRYATRLDRAHELVADPEDLKFSTLSNIARKLLNRRAEADLDPVDLFTTRLALTRAGYAFGYDLRHHRLTAFVHIRSKAHVAMVAQVRDWMRQYRDELARNRDISDPLKVKFRSSGGQVIQAFAKKAREVIQQSRQDREVTQLGTLGPSKTRLDATNGKGCFKYRHGVTWTDDEQLVIKFMESWACQRSFTTEPSLESQSPLVLQATGMYDKFILLPSTGYVFLQEIGCLVPWENRVRFDVNLLIPSSRHSQMLAKMASYLERPSSPATLMIPDTLAHIREERNKTFTYCLDSAGAHEIDDGISLEAQEDGSSWVHVDVANPTAFLDKNSTISKMAQHMTETIYSPDCSYMMLPSWITQNHFSLNEGRPCLRFSARLDEEGTMLEYDVKAGYSRNVKFIDPQEVNKVLGLTEEDSRWQIFTVGGTPPTSRGKSNMLTAETITPTMKKDLERLLTLARKRSAVRRISEGLTFGVNNNEVRVWGNKDTSGLGVEDPSYHRVRFVDGDPIIQLKTREFSPYLSIAADDRGANDMVQEFMLMACYIGAKWMDDRGIPNIYRGSLPVSGSSKETANQYFSRVIKPLAARNDGKIPAFILTEYLVRSTPGTMTLDPLMHQQLGMTHYSRITSPLRRYADMLAHWNIGAALVEEKRKGRTLLPAESEAVALFPRATLERMLPMLRAREDRIKRAKRWGTNLWAVQLLFRAYYYGQMELPKTLRAVITQKPSNLGWIGMFREFEIPCILENTEGAQLGDEYEVAIKAIDVYNAQVKVVPLRLVHREEAIPE
ncbi:RNB-domain-containing protein [Myriangium duriaei CBS 260.36]|uniref:RNB-domain-containing protein n=1 Tax=Myriangium duriaei CBS 260.36 TaxID=1168546 RepID=A0A9P4J8Y7_9PEZI|nr:RNB-domain-containing protein [Myriangium duriaei CBS 260.36]